MNEQELEKDLYQVANDIGYTRESDLQTLLSIAKAYADAKVEESVARQQPIFEAAMDAKNAEIKRLRDGVASVMDRFNFPTEARDRLNALLSPAPVTDDKFSISAYPPECSPTLEQLTENDNLTMMQRLEKRMPPFHKIDSSENKDQE